MSFNFLRSRLPEMSVDRTEIVWGIRRKSGCGDLDDPRAQAGATAHAFAAGRDEIAVCGYRPMRWSRRRAMPLAAASEYNAQCTKCLARLPLVTKSAAAVMPTLNERLAIPVKRSARARRKAAPGAAALATVAVPAELVKAA